MMSAEFSLIEKIFALTRREDFDDVMRDVPLRKKIWFLHMIDWKLGPGFFFFFLERKCYYFAHDVNVTAKIISSTISDGLEKVQLCNDLKIKTSLHRNKCHRKKFI